MKKMMLKVCALAVLVWVLSAGVALAETADELVVFLVRHAEKVIGVDDPELTPAGVLRAGELSRMLRSAGIERVHSSDYKRTRATAKPIADELGLEIELYDPRDLPGMAAALRDAGGRHLVVGHSNTTPQLAELLGCASQTPIDEENEHDRLYVVTVMADGSVSCVLLRIGEPYLEE